MWLLMTAFAAVLVTCLWYLSPASDKYRLGFLSLIYWGATLMWLVDHVMAHVQEGGAFFEIDASATGLGVSVIILGLVVWLIRLIIADPSRIARSLAGGKERQGLSTSSTCVDRVGRMEYAEQN